MSGKWEPIATAPKDGTPVLVGFAANERGPGAVFDAWWDGAFGGWVDGSTDIYGELAPFNHVTHWMPLPEPPEGVSQALGEGQ